MDRLERTIVCEDERGRRYTVHVLRKQETWTGTDGITQRYGGLQKFALADDPRRHITPVAGVDTFEILDDGTIIRSIEPPRP